jgi:hypothetical protein
MIEKVLAHEGNMYYVISQFLYTEEFIAFRSTCTTVRAIPLEPLVCPGLFGPGAGRPRGHVDAGDRAYLHMLLPHAATLGSVAQLTRSVQVLSRVAFPCAEALARFVQSVQGRARENTFFRVFWISASATESFTILPYTRRSRHGSVETDLSAATAADELTPDDLAIQMRLIVKPVPRVGLALGVELDCTGVSASAPLVKVRGNVGRDTGKEVCLRAGFRASDFLRETDSKGFWTDLAPIAEELKDNQPLPVACFVELNDVWK